MSTFFPTSFLEEHDSCWPKLGVASFSQDISINGTYLTRLFPQEFLVLRAMHFSASAGATLFKKEREGVVRIFKEFLPTNSCAFHSNSQSHPILSWPKPGSESLKFSLFQAFGGIQELLQSARLY